MFHYSFWERAVERVGEEAPKRAQKSLLAINYKLAVVQCLGLGSAILLGPSTTVCHLDHTQNCSGDLSMQGCSSSLCCLFSPLFS